LKETDSTWSKTILNYWSTLPPVLLNVVYKAVVICKNKSPYEILELEQKLNAKWRQTDDYKEWLRSKNEWISEESQVNAIVDSYFECLKLPTVSDEAVVYEAPQETQKDVALAVCPVTGQASSATDVCPVSSASLPHSSAVYPVTGQHAGSLSNEEDDKAKCPFSKTSSNTITSEHFKDQAEKNFAANGGCPFSTDQQLEFMNEASCPVTGAMESLS
jgi:hypothetical protein